MNILFFLIPKSDTAYIYSDFTVRQALEKMKHYGYTAIPMIDRDGKYKGTVTEGDFLWTLANDLNKISDLEHISILDIKRRVNNKPVNIDANIEDLMDMSLYQNFIPVIDDQEVFIGLVTRKDIIQYLSKQCFQK
ncbi:CBS domain-containing protein [Lachnotalea glycerini]|jgi:CBS domain-containing protein|uniref:CBS domain-containing protein n=1 Tax=Lachnotalea glycerini TaxID=1763509 RepID=A0A255I790_9FIRM|nr:CBS domain-containing protein [Lachnotalea glycerini]PXV95946.1 CBS domain-containing protein [Lachnotalea glycerini]RDY33005.1 CBS domain-containing protein [Lachnotalea glycerini]